MPDPAPIASTKESASWYWEQWRLAGNLYKNRVCAAHFRPQLKKLLDLKVGGIVVGVERGEDSERDYPTVEQIDVLILPRHAEWLQSQAFDNDPDIKINRDADGDEEGCDVGERVLTRVGYESDEPREYRDGIKDVWANGAAAWIYGYDDDTSTLERMEAKSKGAGEATAEALAGAHKAEKGQDHATIGAAQMAEAQNPETALGPDGEKVQTSLLKGAVEHAKLQDKEAKRPRDWTREPRQVWIKRCPVGTAFRWSPDAIDIRGARLIMRSIVIDVDIARSWEDFTAEARAKIKEGRYERADGYEGEAPEGDEKTVKANQCLIVEVWDRKWDERHYVVEGVGEFLEKDARNPWVDAKGRHTCRYGVPFVYYCPVKPQEDTPLKPFGIPLGSFGWPLQKLMIKLASHNLDAVKKMSVRSVELLGELLEDEEDDLASGVSTVIHRPAELNTEALKMVPLVRPINFGTVDQSVFQQIVWCRNTMSEVMAWPLSQMSGQPQSNTATGEEIAVTAGQSQMGDVIRELEAAVGWGQEIKRTIVWTHYSPEDIAELVGQKSAKTFLEWRTTAPSIRGDRITVTLSASQNNPVRIQQVEKVLLYAESKTDETGLWPKYRTDHLVDEWVRLHRLGKLVKFVPTPAEVAAKTAMPPPEEGGVAPQGGPGKPRGRFTPEGAGGGGGPRRGPGKSAQAPQGPTRAAQFSAAQRV